MIKQLWQKINFRDQQTSIKFDLTLDEQDLSSFDEDMLIEYFIQMKHFAEENKTKKLITYQQLGGKEIPRNI